MCCRAHCLPVLILSLCCHCLTVLSSSPCALPVSLCKCALHCRYLNCPRPRKSPKVETLILPRNAALTMEFDTGAITIYYILCTVTLFLNLTLPTLTALCTLNSLTSTFAQQILTSPTLSSLAHCALPFTYCVNCFISGAFRRFLATIMSLDMLSSKGKRKSARANYSQRVRSIQKTRIKMWHTIRFIYLAGFRANLNIFQPIQIELHGGDVALRCHKLDGQIPDRTLRNGGYAPLLLMVLKG